ncbi:hypothetical protein [Flaviflexus massiliensis]|uniref:hypothetical protein n=1 Tax=Flaviflexus massiliensis TaxID=1522309 RepID=UPI0006D5A3D8|nr:hypothetical protein [Flaviflexus massiliensis]
MISRASKTALALTGIFIVAACSSGADADPTPEVDPVPVGTTKPDLDTNNSPNGQSPESDETPEVSDSGDVEGTLGEPIGLAGGGDEAIFTMTVNSIEHTPTCPSRIDPVDVENENGSFLVADITAEMAANYGEFLEEGEEPFLATATDAFHLTDLKGVVQSDVITISSYECFSIDEQLAPFINPGETAKGVIALDTSLEHGYVVYNPWGVDGSGWRWEF